jgi:glycosyltransferase involved in cell wall biosynthesis
MYRDKKISVVIPCYNEGKQIARVVDTMPDYVDYIIAINDQSKDNTREVIDKLKETNPKVVPIHHEKNQGVGGAIASGYLWSRDNKIDVAVVMAGDGQMDPADLQKVLDPIILDGFDYAKGNRLKYRGAYEIIPKKRFFGNQILSFFTKIASGYWKISDAQNGYAAISLRALRAINWSQMYKRYGQPNDILVRLNLTNMKVCDVIMKPVYGVGEESKMKITRVTVSLPRLLFRLFVTRIYYKYMVQDFNIIAPLYFFGFLNFIMAMIFLIRTLILYFFITKVTPEISFIIFLYTFQMAVFLMILAMNFDMQDNNHLQKK